MKIRLEANRKSILKRALQSKADILSPHYLYCSPKFISSCHENDLRVIPWTVNEPQIMKQLLSAGVDGIISDYPERLYSACFPNRH